MWIVYEANTQYGVSGEVNLYDTEVSEIVIDERGFHYCFREGDYVELKEKDVIPYEDKSALLIKIQEVMNVIHEREKES